MWARLSAHDVASSTSAATSSGGQDAILEDRVEQTLVRAGGFVVQFQRRRCLIDQTT